MFKTLTYTYQNMPMPKRTNEFQQIVYMIQNQLAENAIVTESKMLTSESTKAPVEVDVVIEAIVGAVNLTVGIECTAEKRPSTVEWVREMIGKHQDLPIDKTILVSKSGYTANALKTANAHRFLAITLEKAEKLDWANLVQDLRSLTLGSFAFEATSGIVELEKSQLGGSELTIGPGSQILAEGRNAPLPFKEFVDSIIGNDNVVTQILQKWAKTPVEERANSVDFAVTVTPHTKTQIVTEKGSTFTVKNVQVNVHAELDSTALSLNAAKFLGASIAHGAAKNIFPESLAPDQEVLVTLVKKEGKKTSASLSLLIPEYNGDHRKVFHMDVTTKKDEKSSE